MATKKKTVSVCGCPWDVCYHRPDCRYPRGGVVTEAERLFRAFLETLSDLDLVAAIRDLRRDPEDARHLRWALEELAKRARLATRGRH